MNYKYMNERKSVMKKKICLIVAILSVCAAGFTACGGSDSSSKGGDTPASAAEQKNETKDVAAVADKLKSDIKYADELNELDKAMVSKIIGVNDDLYTAGKVYIGSGGATAEEIACFEAKDEAAAGEIKKALEARIESQKAAFENYQPKEMTKLNDPVLVVSGKYVFMCLSDDNAKAKEIIN